MSTRATQILNPSDLKYLLIDSLKSYSDNVEYVDGRNPYRFSINKKTVYILIRNVHESGMNRENQDECRIQISNSQSLIQALNSRINVIVLGFFADENVFTAWDPLIFNNRFNDWFMDTSKAKTVSVYSRFSIQRNANQNKIGNYVDNNGQSIISFKPEYLGLYLDNITNIHNLNAAELFKFVEFSDKENDEDFTGSISLGKEQLVVTHTRYKRDPNFRKKVYEAYNNKCAMCGIQLELIEAAHIVPHSHESGTDDISNGIGLCSLHHTAYDKSLIYFEIDFSIKINNNKMKYLEKMGLDGGYRKFEDLSFDKLRLPQNHILQPNLGNISLANQIRGIV
jgi:putative restriction endonuclease